MSRPFDEARYRGLLEGLDVAEILLSSIKAENSKLRIDSGYYSHDMLIADMRVRAYFGGFDELGYLFQRFVKGIFDINAESYSEAGVPFLRILNLRNGIIDDNNLVFIPETLHEKEKKTEVLKDDIVLSKTAYPAASLVTLDRCNTSQDTIATTLSEYGKGQYTPEAIVAYLNGSLGERLLWRQFQGNVQLHLSLDDGRKVPVPRLGMVLQQSIALAFRRAESHRREAVDLIKQAEYNLLNALDLENWQPPEPLTYTRSSHDAFAAGRLDAEHFQEKYYAARQALLQAGALDFVSIQELLVSITNGHTPLRHDLTMGEVPFLCAEHISDYEADFDADKRILDIHHRTELARTAICEGDVLLTIKGKVGNAAIAENVPDAANINQDVALLRFNQRLPLWYVVAFLNSYFGKLQSEQLCTGAINPFLGLFSIRQFRIPIFESGLMSEIAEQTRSQVHAARQARRRAAQLLQAAKRAVEIAIEDSEAAALAWLEQALNGNGSLVAAASICQHQPPSEETHDPATDSTIGRAPARMAGAPRQPGETQSGLSPQGNGVHPQLHGSGKRAGGCGTLAGAADSTRPPANATRQLATSDGPLTYSEVAERLAVNIVQCLMAIFDGEPEDIVVTPEWLCDIHRRIAGELFPDWAGRFRSANVQVGTHLPPPPYEVAVHIRNFCLDLEERLCHPVGAESVAELIAWVDWRFQWIHPFNDFNGRVGRILLSALTFKLDLPPVDPSVLESDKPAYFNALRSADAGDLGPLKDLWLERLMNG